MYMRLKCMASYLACFEEELCLHVIEKTALRELREVYLLAVLSKVMLSAIRIKCHRHIISMEEGEVGGRVVKII